MDPSFLDDLTRLPGLEADATPDTILASVRALMKVASNPDPARFAPVEAMRDWALQPRPQGRSKL